MNSAEASELITLLLTRYEGTSFDGAIADTFASSLAANDYALSKQAVESWTARVEHFPTNAELNAEIRRLQGRESNVRQLPVRDDVVDVQRAKEAFARGYIQSRTKLGDDMETIEQKLAVYLRKFPGSIPGFGS